MNIRNISDKDIIIREATNKEANSIVEFIFHIWVEEHHFEIKKEDFPDLRDIEKYYNIKDGNLFLTALINNEIAGTCACNKLNHNSFVLKRMFVKKAYRGLGIAQLLLDQLFSQIVLSKEARDISFFLSTKENEAIAAKRFYLKNGFQIINKKDLPEKFPFFYKDDLFMVKNKWN